MTFLHRAARRLRWPLAGLGALVLLALAAVPIVQWSARTLPVVRAVAGVLDDPSINWSLHRFTGEWKLIPSAGGEPVTVEVPAPLRAPSGTYLMTIRSLTPGKDYAIGLQEVASAYRLTIDGQVRAERGVPDLDPQGYRAEVGPRVALFTPAGTEAKVELKVVDLSSSVGGLWIAPVIGPAPAVLAAFQEHLSLDLFLLASVWVLAVVLWIHALILGRDRSIFFLALISSALLVKCAFSESMQGFVLFPSLNYETGMVLCYLAMVVVLPLFFEVGRRVFPAAFPRWLVRIWWLPAAVETALVLVTPFASYQAGFWWFQLVLLVGGIVFIALMLWAVFRRETGAGLFLAGFLVLLASGINDALYANGLVNTGYLLNLGLFLFLMSQTFLTALRFRRALKSAEERSTFEQWAKEDALTGLINRRQLDEVLDVEFRGFHRYGQTFAVLMIDLDHFKPMNDTHGHLVGDKLLAHVAHCLSGRLRKTDVCGRFGGEEFLVLLRHTTLEEARLTAEILRKAVEESVYEDEGLKLPMTISVGAAEVTTDCSDVASLVERADRALYRAKSAGRNRVELG